jgi:type II secretory pathway component PulF
MSRYRCLVSDSRGKRSEIVREAPTARDLVVTLNKENIFLISHFPVAENEKRGIKKRFSKDTVLEFTEIMATLLKAGLTIQDSLEMCASIAASTKTASLSKGLLYGVVQGIPFHQALKIYGPSFSPLYQALVRLGEKTGSAAGVFSRMSAYLRSEKKIRRKLGNALWYPALVVLIAVLGCIGLVSYIMPRMTYILSIFNINDEVMNIEIGRVYRSLWASMLVLAVFIAASASVLLLRKVSESFALRLDRLILYLPVIGDFLRSVHTLDFSFAMEMLTGSGITVGNALKESSTVIRNRAYRGAILAVYGRLLKGERLSRAFTEQREFPPYISTWIAVGERTGTVELVFTQIRDYFQSDVDNDSERLMGMIEPLLTLSIGIVVLILIVQFVLPVFSLYGRIL